jgi:hypothetical protein
MANIIIQVDDAGNASVMTTTQESVSVQVSYTPSLTIGTLQGVWDASDDPDKNTFVDDNEAEIVTFFNDQPIFLSTEGSAAIANIESNGGTLTDEEKYFVDIWVSRMVDEGEWALIRDLAYAGFADSICARSKWVTGGLMTSNGVSYNGETWSFSGFNDQVMHTGIIPSTIGISLNNVIAGIYLEDTDGIDTDDDGIFGCSIGSNNLKFNVATAQVRFRVNNQSVSSYNIPKPLKNSLATLNRVNSAQQNLVINGTVVKNESDISTSLPTIEIIIGGINNSGTEADESKFTASLFFIGDGIGFNQLDFYAGYEDFRTSLHPQVLYNLVEPTGQTTSYRTGDDANIESVQLLHFRAAMSQWNGTSPELVNFYGLAQNNAFGNTNRFTDEDGLQVYGSGYLIDHYTGLGWSTVRATSANWDNNIDNALASSVVGFTDWFLPNMSQLTSIYRTGNTSDIGLNYSPFTISFNDIVPASTTDPLPTTNNLALRGKQTQVYTEVKTNSRGALYCRKHY